MKRCITEAKRTEERSWLGEVSASMLQQSLRDLSQAVRNWWQGKGRVRAPNFKKRGNCHSIRACGEEFYPTDTGVRFPKIGVLRLQWSRPLSSEPSSVTIIKECSGKYYASFVVEVEDEKLPPTPKEVGIDLGLASLAVTSDGEKFAPPRFLRSALRKIGRLQRSLNRKVKGSRNRNKARLLLANAQEKVGSKRLGFLHKLSTQLIRENQTVVVEDLNVSGMLKNRRLSKNISDAGWRMFRTLLEYKAERYGREVRVISSWEPTSQRCSECGHQVGKKPLSVRTWTCPVCGSKHDRDINAAKNILAVGQAERLNAVESRVSPACWCLTLKQEPVLIGGHIVPPEERESPSVTAGRMSTGALTPCLDALQNQCCQPAWLQACLCSHLAGPHCRLANGTPSSAVQLLALPIAHLLALAAKVSFICRNRPQLHRCSIPWNFTSPSFSAACPDRPCKQYSFSLFRDP